MFSPVPNVNVVVPWKSKDKMAAHLPRLCRRGNEGPGTVLSVEATRAVCQPVAGVLSAVNTEGKSRARVHSRTIAGQSDSVLSACNVTAVIFASLRS